MRNLSAGTTILISRENGASAPQGNDESYQPSITPDGRYIGFSSRATNLASGDTNGSADVFVRDMTVNTNRRISIAINGNQGWQDSYNSSMSDDGRYVVFVSNQGFVNGDTNNLHDVFMRDTVANTMTRISVDSQGKQANGGASGGIGTAAGWGARISGDGTKVFFQSLATNLTKADNNGVEDVFVRNLLNNTTTMVSLSTAGKPANGFSGTPTVSYNGQYVAFISAASNIVSGDTNGGLDAFRRGSY
jgi:Tol biopolymer transport system component